MNVLSIDTEKKYSYKISFECNNVIKNILITRDGIYTIHYINNGIIIHNTGKIILLTNDLNDKNGYILLDYSMDASNKTERIYFYQIRDIIDVTPNNAYKIAIDHGFKGTIEEWLQHMKGKSAYEIAIDNGFKGTIEEWFALNGDVTLINKELSNAKKDIINNKNKINKVGLPTGGITGQVLKKKSESDYDAEWKDDTGVQSDWDQNDSEKPDFIKNKITPEDNSIVIQALIDTDLIPAVQDKTGILSDENGNILMW